MANRKFNFKLLLELAKKGELDAKYIRKLIKAAEDFGLIEIAHEFKLCLAIPFQVILDQNLPKQMIERIARSFVFFNDRGKRLTRTKQMLPRHGIVETIRRNTARKGVSKNLEILFKEGLLELSSEAIVRDYPEFFDAETIMLANNKLASLSS
jgi:hypothetical protein